MSQKVSVPFILASTLVTSGAIAVLVWLRVMRQRAQRLHLVLVHRPYHIPVNQRR